MTRFYLLGFILATAMLGLTSLRFAADLEEQKRLNQDLTKEKTELTQQLQALREAQLSPPPPPPSATPLSPPPAPVPAVNPDNADRDRLLKALAVETGKLKELQDTLQHLKGGVGGTTVDADSKIRDDDQKVLALQYKISSIQAGVAEDAGTNQASIQATQAQETQTTQGIQQNIDQVNGSLALVNQQLTYLNQNKNVANRTAQIQLLQMQQFQLKQQLQGLKQSLKDSKNSATATENSTKGQIKAENAQYGAYEQGLKNQISALNRDKSYWQGVKASQGNSQKNQNAQIQAAQAAVGDQQAVVNKIKADLDRYSVSK